MKFSAVLFVQPNSRFNHGSQFPCPSSFLHSLSRRPISFTSLTTRLPIARIVSACSARKVISSLPSLIDFDLFIDVLRPPAGRSQRRARQKGRLNRGGPLFG